MLRQMLSRVIGMGLQGVHGERPILLPYPHGKVNEHLPSFIERLYCESLRIDS
ncbi:hypothetical protein B296_00023823 [Ensete ventricosum]|uniref:Uncharacterized protein n=1 Tax=Ensete ventricosum TaxID=4639 RepID=A0A426Z248_ENSVE|nr:hypothetical protein B296_00023823 [Ensete ventricosum]